MQFNNLNRSEFYIIVAIVIYFCANHQYQTGHSENENILNILMHYLGVITWSVELSISSIYMKYLLYMYMHRKPLTLSNFSEQETCDLDNIIIKNTTS